jgi:hypothetical protein
VKDCLAEIGRRKKFTINEPRAAMKTNLPKVKLVERSGFAALIRRKIGSSLNFRSSKVRLTAASNVSEICIALEFAALCVQVSGNESALKACVA